MGRRRSPPEDARPRHLLHPTRCVIMCRQKGTGQCTCCTPEHHHRHQLPLHSTCCTSMRPTTTQGMAAGRGPPSLLSCARGRDASAGAEPPADAAPSPCSASATDVEWCHCPLECDAGQASGAHLSQPGQQAQQLCTCSRSGLSCAKLEIMSPIAMHWAGCTARPPRSAAPERRTAQRQQTPGAIGRQNAPLRVLIRRAVPPKADSESEVPSGGGSSTAAAEVSAPPAAAAPAAAVDQPQQDKVDFTAMQVKAEFEFAVQGCCTLRVCGPLPGASGWSRGRRCVGGWLPGWLAGRPALPCPALSLTY